MLNQQETSPIDASEAELLVSDDEKARKEQQKPVLNQHQRALRIRSGRHRFRNKADPLISFVSWIKPFGIIFKMLQTFYCCFLCIGWRIYEYYCYHVKINATHHAQIIKKLEKSRRQSKQRKKNQIQSSAQSDTLYQHYTFLKDFFCLPYWTGHHFYFGAMWNINLEETRSYCLASAAKVKK